MKISMVCASGVGVIIAATTAMMAMAYRKLLHRNFGVTIPNNVKKKISMGNSNTNPSPSKTIRIKSKYSLMLSSGATEPPNCWKPTRNFNIYGRVTKYPKAIPAKNKNTVENRKPVTALRSCLYSAGATNNQIWYSTNGDASTIPMYTPSVMTRFNAPAGWLSYSFDSKCASF